MLKIAVNMELHKLWTSDKCIRPLNLNETFHYHLIAFYGLSSIQPGLICHTFADNPARGIATHGGSVASDSIYTAITRQIFPHAGFHGERSIWMEPQKNITIFVEILTKSSRHIEITRAIRAYQAKRNLVNEEGVDGEIRKKDVDFYVCSAFYYYWFVKDVGGTPDPYFGVWDAAPRADVSEAQGLRALRWMEKHLRRQEYEPILDRLFPTD